MEQQIGKNCADLIHDGDCLQLGIGGIPNAVCAQLWDKKDLGLHSELVGDGVVGLLEAGVINNAKKQIHRGRTVIGAALGTDKLNTYINNNPSVEMHPINYVNNPSVIAKNDNVVSINSCLQVDLLGQVVADTVGLNQFSAVGGQVDFVRGATMSRGGRSIIAMPSTAKRGHLSRIVPIITEGSAITTPRNDVNYVVTEYGVALGLDNFSGTVGGNVSGTSDLAPLDQQADMIVEWMPEVKKVGLLYCSAEANSQYQVDEVQKYLEAKGVTATQYAFSDSNDLSSVCQKAADENDALYVPTDNTVAANTGIVDGICRPAKKPVFAGEEGICSGCGVATLSISYYDLGYTTGEMAVKILNGESDISTMPIEYTDVTKKYNKTICDDLGMTVPEGYEAIEE